MVSALLPRSGVRWLLLGCVVWVGVATGCASSRDGVEAPVQTTDSFSASGETAAPDRWWTAFDDAGLNAAVDTALANNFDLRAAWERLRAAQAVVDRASASLLPRLEATAGASATERSDANAERTGDGSGGGSGGGEPGARAPADTDLRLGAVATYEVDLWGRLRSRVDAERFRADASRAAYETARLTLAAEITRTWYQRAEARSQVALAREQVETNAQVLDLLEERFRTGQIRRVDVLRQRQLLESTREALAFAESREAVIEHQLAVLLGRSPLADSPLAPSASADAVPEPPPLPDAGVPAALVERRPDVRAAFFDVRAADADLAAALNDRYPRLTLTASASTASESTRDLFENWVASVAGDLLAPLFYGGELRAEADRAEAVRQEAVYRYGQTVLQAFQDVEDALVLERKQREQVASLREQTDLAQQAYDQLRVAYLNGAASYIDVLTALRDVQQLRRDVLTAERTLVEDRIALYRALAGPVDAPTADDPDADG